MYFELKISYQTTKKITRKGDFSFYEDLEVIPVPLLSSFHTEMEGELFQDS
jgi:hypothetical protein